MTSTRLILSIVYVFVSVCLSVCAAAALSSAVLPLLHGSGGGGRVVHIGSISGQVLTSGECPYAASKYALEALADAMRLELGASAAAQRIAVSLVQPGWVATPLCPPTECPSAEGAGPVVEAVLHALRSPRPLSRYAVTSVDGVPTSVLLWLAWALPDYWQDMVVREFWDD